MTHFKCKIFVWFITLFFSLSQTLLADGVPIQPDSNGQPTVEVSGTNTSSESDDLPNPNDPQDNPLLPADEESEGGSGSSVPAITGSIAINSQALITNNQVVTLTLQASGGGIRGDGNEDGNVDAADYVIWRKNAGSSGPAGDYDGSGLVDQTDYNLWKSQFGRTNGVVEMSFSNDGINFSPWEAYQTTKDWTLTSGDGRKTVYIKFRDEFGNESEIYSDAILYDGPPMGSMVVNNGDSFTSNQEVTLTLQVSDLLFGDGNGDGKVDAADYVIWRKNLGWQSSGPGNTNIADYDGNGIVEQTDYDLWRSQFGKTKTIEMAFSQDGGATFSDFEAFNTTKVLTLLGPDGEKMVFIRFRDEAGNTVDVQDTIILDTAAPAEGGTFTFRQKFLNPNPVNVEQFGTAVAIVGKNFAVAAPLEQVSGGIRAGAVYLLDENGNVLHTFLSPTPQSLGRFGWSIAAVGNNLIVAEPEYVVGLVSPGAVHLFDANPDSPTFGNLLHTFENPTPASVDQFGFSVAYSEGKLLVGARGDDTGAGDTGAAYLFDADPTSPAFGTLLHTFLNPTPEAGDLFGSLVAFIDHHILIGAHYGSDDASTDVGSFYLFDGDLTSSTFGNLLHSFLNLPSPFAGGNYLGYSRERYSVASLDRYIVLGVPFFDDLPYAPDTGIVYIFDGDPNRPTFGSLIKTLQNPSPSSHSPFNNHYFGASVTAVDKMLFVGAPGDNTLSAWSGAFYLFDGDTASQTFGELKETFLNPDPYPALPEEEYFGASIAADTFGNLVVGSPMHPSIQGGFNIGRAYRYQFQGLGVRINDGVASTTSPDVLITFDVMDNLTLQSNLQMAFSQDGINFTSFESFSETKQITLEGGDGEKTVYVRFRDEAGNVSEFSDTIILQQSGAASLSSASVAPLNQTAQSSEDIPVRAPLFWQATALNNGHLTSRKEVDAESSLEHKPRKSSRLNQHNGSHLGRKQKTSKKTD